MTLDKRTTLQNAIKQIKSGQTIMGNANGAGEENGNVGRMSLLLAGLP